MTLYDVIFEAELGVDIEPAEGDEPSPAECRQAVQDAIGHTGAIVTEAVDYRTVGA